MALTFGSLKVTSWGRLGPTMGMLHLDSSALDTPILEAMTWLGLPLADPFLVTDEDLATIEGAEYLRLLDMVELRALWLAAGNPAWFDQTKGNTSQSLSQLRDAIMARIEFLTQQVALPYEPPAVPGPGHYVSGLLRAGRCEEGYPYNCERPHPWRGSWCPW